MLRFTWGSSTAIPNKVVLGLVLLISRSAAAHNGAVDLLFWGDYGTAARCQRAVAVAARQCVDRTWTAHRSCLAGKETAAQCDQDTLSARSLAERQHAAQAVQASCTPEEVAALGLGTIADAQDHVRNTCVDLETSLVSAVYGPMQTSAPVAVASTTPDACVSAVSRAAEKLIRTGLRAREVSFGRIAARYYGPSAKLGLVAAATQRLARVRARLQQHVQDACSTSTTYPTGAGTLLDAIGQRSDCFAGAVFAQTGVTCPAPVCGNGMQEAGEECDDGNSVNDDECRSDCVSKNCEVLPSTYALIQRAIFERHGCTSGACHGQARSGGLDLRADGSYDRLVGVDSTSSPFKLISPGDEEHSVLWVRLAKATLGRADLPGTPMPLGFAPVSRDALDALAQWIRTGASPTAILPGSDLQLHGCLPATETQP